MKKIKGHVYLEKGDRVCIKRLNYISPLIRGKVGTVTYVHPHTEAYTVLLDKTRRIHIVKANEVDVLEN